MKKPVYQWRFKSSSGSGTYETLRWDDDSLSCDCPGWTRRCVDGQRTCKHVRCVEANCGNEVAMTHGPVGAAVAVAAAVDVKTTQPKLKQSVFGRKFV